MTIGFGGTTTPVARQHILEHLTARVRAVPERVDRSVANVDMGALGPPRADALGFYKRHLRER